MAVGRDSKGRLKKGYKLTKAGVRKVTKRATKKSPARKKRKR